MRELLRAEGPVSGHALEAGSLLESSSARSGTSAGAETVSFGSFAQNASEVFSPAPMLASWRTRKAEFAPQETDDLQPTEERFMFLLRKSLSRKPENRLTEREKKEIGRVRAKLSAGAYKACVHAATLQRKQLKQLPKAERLALEGAVRLRTEMQMLELELRGSDVSALEHAVERFEQPSAHAAAQTHPGHYGRPQPGAAQALARSQPASAEPALAEGSEHRAARTLLRQLLRAVQVERARSRRLEQLLAEQAASLPPICARADSSHGSEDSSHGAGGAQAGAAGGGDGALASPPRHSLLNSGGSFWPLSPLTSPLLRVQAGDARPELRLRLGSPLGGGDGSGGALDGDASSGEGEQGDEPPRRADGGADSGRDSSELRESLRHASAPREADPSAGPQPQPSAQLDVLRSPGGAAALRVGFSSPLAARVHSSIESEMAALQKRTEEILGASLAHGGVGAGQLGAMGRVVERALQLSRDVAALRQLTRSAERRASLEQLGGLLRALEGYVASLRAEMQGSHGAELEDAYVAGLRRVRRVVEVPADGNCLFHAVSEGLRRRAAAGGGVPSARELRARCAARVREGSARFEEALRLAAAEAMALGGGRLGEGGGGGCADGEGEGGEPAGTGLASSAQLRAALVRAHGAELDLDALSAAQLGAAYSEVRARDGVFGERLELALLSEELQLPLALFYRAGGAGCAAAGDGGAEPSPAAVSPVEVFGAREAGEPIELLCLLARRHYRLLLPLPEGAPGAAGAARAARTATTPLLPARGAAAAPALAAAQRAAVEGEQRVLAQLSCRWPFRSSGGQDARSAAASGRPPAAPAMGDDGLPEPA